MEHKVLLIDPLNSSTSRTVFRIPEGTPYYAKKIRIVNFGLSNSTGDAIYFNHAGVYSLLSRLSIFSRNGTEIDYCPTPDCMAIKLLHMENSSQFNLGRQLSMSMCNSIVAPSLSQISLTEEGQKDDATLMGDSLFIDVSLMLNYLQASHILDHELTIICEWQDPSILGYPYTFTKFPVLCITEPLMEKADPSPVVNYLTFINDRIVIPSGSNSINQRLNSYYNMYIRNYYYYNILDRKRNLLGLPQAKKNELFNLQLNGKKLLPLTGTNNSARALALTDDMTGSFNICNYSSYAFQDAIDDTVYGLYNPNLAIKYAGNFAYKCVRLDTQILMDLTMEYSFSEPDAPPPAGQTDTVVTLAEVLRSYNKDSQTVSFVRG